MTAVDRAEAIFDRYLKMAGHRPADIIVDWIAEAINAAIEEARKDTARLDWIQGVNKETDVTFYCGCALELQSGISISETRKFEAADYRSAIDAAMQREAQNV